MHGADVVMYGHGLNNAVVPPKLACNRIKESIKGLNTAISAIRSPAARHPEAYIVIRTPESSWLAMVIVAPGYNPAMYVQYELPVYGVFRRLSR